MQSYYPIAVQPLEDYLILITFDNNTKRIFDLTPYLKDDFFSTLANKNIFKQAKINSLTIEWPNGIDICPDELYYNSKPL